MRESKYSIESQRCKYCNKKLLFNSRTYCSYSCSLKHQWQIGLRKALKRTGKKVECGVCGIEIYRRPSRYNKTKVFFCSTKCYQIHLKRNNFTTNCNECGLDIEVKGYKKNQLLHFCNIKCKSQWQSKNMIGESSSAWRGGYSDFTARLRQTKKYHTWRKFVFKRDSFVCQKCEYDKGGMLQAHHIATQMNIIRKNNIMNGKQALICNELWDVDNGITLCKKCHRELHETNKGYKFTIGKQELSVFLNKETA